MTDTDPTARAHTDVLGGLPPEQVRVRFAPSPTGNLHVGAVRTALFNWVFARHHGGTLVLRIEDTDSARSTEESYRNVLGSLRWLGIDWDEGPEAGGGHGPYLQSERRDTYAEVAGQLLAGGHAYRCYCATEEVEARAKARPKGAPSGYDGHCRELTEEQVAAFEAEGRRSVLRMRMPDGEIVFDDLVRGEVRFDTAHVPDYVVVRANGDPLYTLTNPVDDALMGITHVLRGEDLLSSTPRQIVMYAALAAIGVGPGRTPIFGHLPFVMGEGNKKLSKRDKGGGLEEYQRLGYLPEGLLNYLALLGWAIAEDRDVFTMAEMIEAFDIRRVNANPARFDPKKCQAINAAHVRLLEPAEFATRIVPSLVAAGLVTDPPGPEQQSLINSVVPIIQERTNTLSEVPDLVRFLFVPDDELEIQPDAGLKPDAVPTLTAAREALAGLDVFDHASIEAALRTALIEGLGLKPRHAFGPLRAAVSGRRISPPLFESLELLGKESALRRIDAALAHPAVEG